MATLKLTNISFYYPGAPNSKILDDVSISIDHGQVLSLIGQSGSGKSSLLRLIAGFEEPTAGVIVINEQIVFSNKINIATEKRQVGMIFQDYSLFPHLTVAQNIGFGLSMLPKERRNKEVKELLELIHLANLAKRYPYEISGGQQQRVAIARALATRPAILLFDEPFSNLDPDLRIELRHDVKLILQESQISTLFVTHDTEEARAMGDELLVLSQGHLIG